MTTQQQIQAVPEGFEGSLPEFIVFSTLLRLGLRPNVDFTFQSRFFGGRTIAGGLIVDFFFTNPPGLAINVQGEFFHLEQGAPTISRDRMARAALAGDGITLIFIDEQDILRDPEFYVRAALNYQDLSTLGG